jgi:serine kinase of HPr protein (carbohydrate metabolism regulator)
VTSSECFFLQATVVELDGIGVLLRGPSGSGKSDLALRLIDGGARLVADDGVELARDGDRLIARFPKAAPDSLRGRMEVRGLGILPAPSLARTVVGLVVDLVPADAVERLPEPAETGWLGIRVPVVALAAFEASAAAKVRLAARLLARSIIRPP